MTTLKTLAAAAVVAVAGSAAFAGPNYIVQSNPQNLTSVATLDLVRAETDATVSIYDFHGGERGELLGTTDVTAGANTNVKVRLKPSNSEDIIAVLSNGAGELAVSDVNNFQ
ncbi:hypothetical protein [Celeribacter litoreus]|uniref:hypothetical protein n=1 Tax=Celeribacter litoreus TaxID=2876714 RepID=UPI001CCD45F9|nr:hypothetical protein [Celeribacter litoreus]MCA0044500.1 hypothetical protein [Celeribacter litoreus]MCA0044502.1 hypothetical protein [Celeribacter litoreus]